MNRKTIFVSRPLEAETSYAFDAMIQKISTEAKISPALVRKYGGQAFQDWESQTGRNLSALVGMKSEDRSANIYTILEKFRTSMEPIIPSVKKLDKTMCIASVSLEIMFGS